MDARLVGILLAFSCGDASGDESALLQTAASMHRSSVPTNFFDDQFNVPSVTAAHSARGLGPPPMALFDVGADSVPMPPRVRGPLAERLDTSRETLSIAEPDVQSASLSQATEQAGPTELAGNPQMEQPDPLLNQAFKMVEEMHKVRPVASPSRGQPLVATATVSDPPVFAQEVEASPKEMAVVPKLEPATQGYAAQTLPSDPRAIERKPAANQDREDAASSFVECQENGGGSDCLDRAGKAIETSRTHELQRQAAAIETSRTNELQRQAAESQRFERRQLQLTHELQAIERNHRAHEATDLHRMRQQRRHLYERASQWQMLAQKQRSREVEAFDQMRQHSQSQEDARLAQWRKLSNGWRKPASDMRMTTVDTLTYRPESVRRNYGGNPIQDPSPLNLYREQLPEQREASFTPLRHTVSDQQFSREQVPEQRLSLEQLTRRLEEDERRLFPTALENAATSATLPDSGRLPQTLPPRYRSLPQQYMPGYSLPDVDAFPDREFEHSPVDSQFAQ